ncbi:MAG: YceI family protein [Bacteroidetes bacterium]|nr:YceI family protein [Bacteroidota bacterium]
MKTLILIALLLLSAPLVAQKSEYHVDKKAGHVVKFISDAPIEDFEGVTDRIDGYLIAGAGNWTENSDLYFEVDLRTLDTGIGLRNRHMREDYLHTDKYPYAKYRGRIVSASPAGGKTSVKVQGSMDIHGVRKSLNVDGFITETNGGIRIKTEFEVQLTNHNIEVPQFMFLKIDETMQLVLDVQLKKIKG